MRLLPEGCPTVSGLHPLLILQVNFLVPEPLCSLSIAAEASESEKGEEGMRLIHPGLLRVSSQLSLLGRLLSSFPDWYLRLVSLQIFPSPYIQVRSLG